MVASRPDRPATPDDGPTRLEGLNDPPLVIPPGPYRAIQSRRWTLLRMSIQLAAGAIVFALVATGCANDSGPIAGAGTTTGGTPGQSEGAGAGDYGGYGGGGGSSDGSSGEGGAAAALTVSLVNFRFSPARISVGSGASIELKDTNPQTPHTFTVRESDIDVALDPQSSATVEIALDPGTYEVICRFHEAQGMTATLVVT
jgi:plastocyanin